LVEEGFSMVTRISILGALLSIFILPVNGSAATGVVVPSSEASQEIVIQDVTAKDGSVSGTVVNNSSKTVRMLSYWSGKTGCGTTSVIPAWTVPAGRCALRCVRTSLRTPARRLYSKLRRSLRALTVGS
jgi:hypothetical protein